jgi:hypothetical protein
VTSVHEQSQCLAALQGGARALWAGLRPALIASVPMVGIYMPLYDVVRDGLEPSIGSAAPIVASSMARTVAVCCVAPLEVLRTQLMSGRAQLQTSQPPQGACCRLTASAGRAVAHHPLLGVGWLRGLNATVRPTLEAMEMSA